MFSPNVNVALMAAMNDPDLFDGFAMEDIQSGLEMIAIAVNEEKAVTNNTTATLRNGMKAPVPFLIQNHTTLDKAAEAWDTSKTG